MRMIVLANRITGEKITWPEGSPYNGKEWLAVDSTAGAATSAASNEMEKAFAEEGLLLGDAIAMATSKLGLTPCPSCKRRQEWINEWHSKGKSFVKDLVKQLKGESNGK